MKIPDFHQLCREALAAELNSFCTGRFDVSARCCAPFPLWTNAAFIVSPDNPYGAAVAIAAHAFRCSVFGVRMISAAHATSKGYVNFSFTDRFYDMLMNEAIKIPLIMPKLHDPQTTAEYAFQRMCMIERAHGCAETCPEDDEARAALWTALGIPAARKRNKLLLLRLEQAAKLLLAAPSSSQPRQRRERLDELSGIATAGARMLAFGLNVLNKGNAAYET